MQNKKEKFSEWYSEVIESAELADMRYNVKGFLVHRPWSVMAMKKMYAYYEAALEARGQKPVWFPAVIPEGNFLIEKEHVEGFAPNLFWVTHVGEEKLPERLALRPTSETAMFKLYSLWIQGHSDLPLKLYQSSQVWRYETKATKPFIRGREFHWIETHDAFATEKEARAQVTEDMETTKEIIEGVFGLPFIFFKRPEWDKFPGAVATYAADTLMPDGRVLQLPSTHLLGQNFSKAFDITFTDAQGKKEYVWQTCYGPAIWRIFGAMIAIHGDDTGLILPYAIVPTQVVIVPIHGKERNEKVSAFATKLQKDLQAKGVRVEIDDRDLKPGNKYFYWELRGVPFRIEVGAREIEEGKVSLATRGSKDRVSYAANELDFAAMGKKFDTALKELAIKNFKARVAIAKTEKDLEKPTGLVRIPFCSVEKDGEACAKKLKEKYALDVRGEQYESKDKVSGFCMMCGKQASALVYAAKQY